MTSPTRAELSSISAQVEELMNRVTAIADNFRHTPDSAFVAECNAAERNLMSALRAMSRALKNVP